MTYQTNKTMNRENLVILKDNAELLYTLGGDGFELNKFYRCIQNDKSYIVNGYSFGEIEFDKLFETAYARILRDWRKANLFKFNGGYQPMSKTAFKGIIDLRRYGSVRTGFYVGYVMFGNRELYQFDSAFAIRDKKTAVEEFYSMYLLTIGGDMTYIDNGSITYGNCGTPIGYGKPRIMNMAINQ